VGSSPGSGGSSPARVELSGALASSRNEVAPAALGQAAAPRAATAGRRQSLAFEIRGLDYARLSADPSLLGALSAALGEALGTPGAPGKVQLAPATAADDAQAAGASRGVVVTTDLGSRTEEEEASLPERLAAAAADVDGVASAADGAISSVAMGRREEEAPAVQPTSQAPSWSEAVAAAAAPSAFGDDPDVCEPGCIESQGVCEDRICFCRTPYTGLQCEKKVKGGLLRFSYTAVAFATLFAALAGSAVGMMLFRASVEAQRQLTTFGEEEGISRSEVWKPAAR